jgi:hypothetical protein
VHELFLILDAYGDRSQLIGYLLEPLTQCANAPGAVRAYYRRDIDVALIGLAYTTADIDRVRLLAQRSGVKVIDPDELDEVGRQSFADQLEGYQLIVERGDLDKALAELAQAIRRSERAPTTVERPRPGEYRRGRSRDVGVDLGPRGPRHVAPLDGGARGTRSDLNTPSHLARGTYTSMAREVATRPPAFAPQSTPSRARRLDRISVHVSRGDEWVAGRLRFLSATRVAVAATATPQVGDPFSLALAYGTRELTIPAVVDSVDRALDLSTPMSTGFSAVLDDLSPQQSRSLIDMLHEASRAGLELTPPPLRPARFAVSWPLIVKPIGGEPVRVTALDVSLDGMFIRQCDLGGRIEFALPVDERGPAIRGYLEVVREMSPAAANDLGFTPGSGVAIRQLAAGDRSRYDAFIGRVRERNERRLLVAAASDQLAPLVTGLRAVGYAVTSSSDPSDIVESISGKLRPDVAVIDNSLTRLESEAELLMSLLREHHIFTLATGGKHVEETRRAVDELLGI